MQNIYSELLDMVNRVSARVPLPCVKEVIIPQLYSDNRSKYSKFGLMVLEDSSCGFFYDLDIPAHTSNSSQRDRDELSQNIAGARVEEIAKMILGHDTLSRGIGLAAINALSAHVFRLAGFTLPISSTGSTDVSHKGGHIGMIGYFPPVVKQLRASNCPLTVLELDESLYDQQDNYLVTAESENLQNCDVVLCTSSTLINNTLEPLLKSLGVDNQSSSHITRFELIGPSCSCFADPFFKRGVDSIGGSSVVSPEILIKRVTGNKQWGDAVAKFKLTPEVYPGFDTILDAL